MHSINDAYVPKSLDYRSLQIRRIHRQTGSRKKSILKHANLKPYLDSEFTVAHSSKIAQDVERYIKQTKIYVKETPHFIDGIRNKIMFLHNYNLNVVEMSFKYPLTRSFRRLLLRYFILECNVLYKKNYSARYEAIVEERVLRLLLNIHNAYLESLMTIPPGELIRETAKAVLNLIISVKTEFDVQYNLMENMAKKLLTKMGELEKITAVMDKRIPCPLDTYLSDPSLINSFKNIITSAYGREEEESRFAEEIEDVEIDTTRERCGRNSGDLSDVKHEIDNISLTDRFYRTQIKNLGKVPTIHLDDDGDEMLFWDEEIKTSYRSLRKQEKEKKLSDQRKIREREIQDKLFRAHMPIKSDSSDEIKIENDLELIDLVSEDESSSLNNSTSDDTTDIASKATLTVANDVIVLDSDDDDDFFLKNMKNEDVSTEVSDTLNTPGGHTGPEIEIGTVETNEIMLDKVTSANPITSEQPNKTAECKEIVRGPFELCTSPVASILNHNLDDPKVSTEKEVNGTMSISENKSENVKILVICGDAADTNKMSFDKGSSSDPITCEQLSDKIRGTYEPCTSPAASIISYADLDESELLGEKETDDTVSISEKNIENIEILLTCDDVSDVTKSSRTKYTNKTNEVSFDKGISSDSMTSDLLNEITEDKEKNMDTVEPCISPAVSIMNHVDLDESNVLQEKEINDLAYIIESKSENVEILVMSGDISEAVNKMSINEATSRDLTTYEQLNKTASTSEQLNKMVEHEEKLRDTVELCSSPAMSIASHAGLDESEDLGEKEINYAVTVSENIGISVMCGDISGDTKTCMGPIRTDARIKKMSYDKESSNYSITSEQLNEKSEYKDKMGDTDEPCTSPAASIVSPADLDETEILGEKEIHDRVSDSENKSECVDVWVINETNPVTFDKDSCNFPIASPQIKEPDEWRDKIKESEEPCTSPTASTVSRIDVDETQLFGEKEIHDRKANSENRSEDVEIEQMYSHISEGAKTSTGALDANNETNTMTSNHDSFNVPIISEQIKETAEWMDRIRDTDQPCTSPAASTVSHMDLDETQLLGEKEIDDGVSNSKNKSEDVEISLMSSHISEGTKTPTGAEDTNSEINTMTFDNGSCNVPITSEHLKEPDEWKDIHTDEPCTSPAASIESNIDETQLLEEKEIHDSVSNSKKKIEDVDKSVMCRNISEGAKTSTGARDTNNKTNTMTFNKDSYNVPITYLQIKEPDEWKDRVNESEEPCTSPAASIASPIDLDETRLLGEKEIHDRVSNSENKSEDVEISVMCSPILEGAKTPTGDKDTNSETNEMTFDKGSCNVPITSRQINTTAEWNDKISDTDEPCTSPAISIVCHIDLDKCQLLERKEIHNRISNTDSNSEDVEIPVMCSHILEGAKTSTGARDINNETNKMTFDKGSSNVPITSEQLKETAEWKDKIRDTGEPCSSPAVSIVSHIDLDETQHLEEKEIDDGISNIENRSEDVELSVKSSPILEGAKSPIDTNNETNTMTFDKGSSNVPITSKQLNETAEWRDKIRDIDEPCISPVASIVSHIDLDETQLLEEKEIDDGVSNIENRSEDVELSVKSSPILEGAKSPIDTNNETNIMTFNKGSYVPITSEQLNETAEWKDKIRDSEEPCISPAVSIVSHIDLDETELLGEEEIDDGVSNIENRSEDVEILVMCSPILEGAKSSTGARDSNNETSAMTFDKGSSNISITSEQLNKTAEWNDKIRDTEESCSSPAVSIVSHIDLDETQVLGEKKIDEGVCNIENRSEDVEMSVMCSPILEGAKTSTGARDTNKETNTMRFDKGSSNVPITSEHLNETAERKDKIIDTEESCSCPAVSIVSHIDLDETQLLGEKEIDDGVSNIENRIEDVEISVICSPILEGAKTSTGARDTNNETNIMTFDKGSSNVPITSELLNETAEWKDEIRDSEEPCTSPAISIVNHIDLDETQLLGEKEIDDGVSNVENRSGDVEISVMCSPILEGAKTSTGARDVNNETNTMTFDKGSSNVPITSEQRNETAEWNDKIRDTEEPCTSPAVSKVSHIDLDETQLLGGKEIDDGVSNIENRSEYVEISVMCSDISEDVKTSTGARDTNNVTNKTSFDKGSSVDLITSEQLNETSECEDKIRDTVEPCTSPAVSIASHADLYETAVLGEINVEIKVVSKELVTHADLYGAEPSVNKEIHGTVITSTNTCENTERSVTCDNMLEATKGKKSTKSVERNSENDKIATCKGSSAEPIVSEPSSNTGLKRCDLDNNLDAALSVTGSNLSLGHNAKLNERDQSTGEKSSDKLNVQASEQAYKFVEEVSTVEKKCQDQTTDDNQTNVTKYSVNEIQDVLEIDERSTTEDTKCRDETQHKEHVDTEKIFVIPEGGGSEGGSCVERLLVEVRPNQDIEILGKAAAEEPVLNNDQVSFKNVANDEMLANKLDVDNCEPSDVRVNNEDLITKDLIATSKIPESHFELQENFTTVELYKDLNIQKEEVVTESNILELNQQICHTGVLSSNNIEDANLNSFSYDASSSLLGNIASNIGSEKVVSELEMHEIPNVPTHLDVLAEVAAKVPRQDLSKKTPKSKNVPKTQQKRKTVKKSTFRLHKRRTNRKSKNVLPNTAIEKCVTRSSGTNQKPAVTSKQKCIPHDFVLHSKITPPANNTYTHELPEFNSTNEDSNDSEGSHLFIDIGREEEIEDIEMRNNKAGKDILEKNAEEISKDNLIIQKTVYYNEPNLEENVCISKDTILLSIPDNDQDNFDLLRQIEEMEPCNSSNAIDLSDKNKSSKGQDKTHEIRDYSTIKEDFAERVLGADSSICKDFEQLKKAKLETSNIRPVKTKAERKDFDKVVLKAYVSIERLDHLKDADNEKHSHVRSKSLDLSISRNSEINKSEHTPTQLTKSNILDLTLSTSERKLEGNIITDVVDINDIDDIPLLERSEKDGELMINTQNAAKRNKKTSRTKKKHNNNKRKIAVAPANKIRPGICSTTVLSETPDSMNRPNLRNIKTINNEEPNSKLKKQSIANPEVHFEKALIRAEDILNEGYNMKHLPPKKRRNSRNNLTRPEQDSVGKNLDNPRTNIANACEALDISPDKKYLITSKLKSKVKYENICSSDTPIFKKIYSKPADAKIDILTQCKNTVSPTTERLKKLIETDSNRQTNTDINHVKATKMDSGCKEIEPEIFTKKDKPAKYSFGNVSGKRDVESGCSNYSKSLSISHRPVQCKTQDEIKQPDMHGVSKKCIKEREVKEKNKKSTTSNHRIKTGQISDKPSKISNTGDVDNNDLDNVPLLERTFKSKALENEMVQLQKKNKSGVGKKRMRGQGDKRTEWDVCVETKRQKHEIISDFLVKDIPSETRDNILQRSTSKQLAASSIGQSKVTRKTNKNDAEKKIRKSRPTRQSYDINEDKQEEAVIYTSKKPKGKNQLVNESEISIHQETMTPVKVNKQREEIKLKVHHTDKRKPKRLAKAPLSEKVSANSETLNTNNVMLDLITPIKKSETSIDQSNHSLESMSLSQSLKSEAKIMNKKGRTTKDKILPSKNSQSNGNSELLASKHTFPDVGRHNRKNCRKTSSSSIHTTYESDFSDDCSTSRKSSQSRMAASGHEKEKNSKKKPTLSDMLDNKSKCKSSSSDATSSSSKKEKVSKKKNTSTDRSLMLSVLDSTSVDKSTKNPNKDRSIVEPSLNSIVNNTDKKSENPKDNDKVLAKPKHNKGNKKVANPKNDKHTKKDVIPGRKVVEGTETAITDRVTGKSKSRKARPLKRDNKQRKSDELDETNHLKDSVHDDASQPEVIHEKILNAYNKMDVINDKIGTDNTTKGQELDDIKNVTLEVYEDKIEQTSSGELSSKLCNVEESMPSEVIPQQKHSESLEVNIMKDRVGDDIAKVSNISLTYDELAMSPANIINEECRNEYIDVSKISGEVEDKISDNINNPQEIYEIPSSNSQEQQSTITQNLTISEEGRIISCNKIESNKDIGHECKGSVLEEDASELKNDITEDVLQHDEDEDMKNCDNRNCESNELSENLACNEAAQSLSENSPSMLSNTECHQIINEDKHSNTQEILITDTNAVNNISGLQRKNKENMDSDIGQPEPLSVANESPLTSATSGLLKDTPQDIFGSNVEINEDISADRRVTAETYDSTDETSLQEGSNKGFTDKPNKHDIVDTSINSKPPSSISFEDGSTKNKRHNEEVCNVGLARQEILEEHDHKSNGDDQMTESATDYCHSSDLIVSSDETRIEQQTPQQFEVNIENDLRSETILTDSNIINTPADLQKNNLPDSGSEENGHNLVETRECNGSSVGNTKVPHDEIAFDSNIESQKQVTVDGCLENDVNKIKNLRYLINTEDLQATDVEYDCENEKNNLPIREAHNHLIKNAPQVEIFKIAGRNATEVKQENLEVTLQKHLSESEEYKPSKCDSSNLSVCTKEESAVSSLAEDKDNDLLTNRKRYLNFEDDTLIEDSSMIKSASLNKKTKLADTKNRILTPRNKSGKKTTKQQYQRKGEKKSIESIISHLKEEHGSATVAAKEAAKPPQNLSTDNVDVSILRKKLLRKMRTSDQCSATSAPHESRKTTEHSFNTENMDITGYNSLISETPKSLVATDDTSVTHEDVPNVSITLSEQITSENPLTAQSSVFINDTALHFDSVPEAHPNTLINTTEDAFSTEKVDETGYYSNLISETPKISVSAAASPVTLENDSVQEILPNTPTKMIENLLITENMDKTGDTDNPKGLDATADTSVTLDVPCVGALPVQISHEDLTAQSSVFVNDSSLHHLDKISVFSEDVCMYPIASQGDVKEQLIPMNEVASDKGIAAEPIVLGENVRQENEKDGGFPFNQQMDISDGRTLTSPIELMVLTSITNPDDGPDDHKCSSFGGPFVSESGREEKNILSTSFNKPLDETKLEFLLHDNEPEELSEFSENNFMPDDTYKINFEISDDGASSDTNTFPLSNYDFADIERMNIMECSISETSAEQCITPTLSMTQNDLVQPFTDEIIERIAIPISVNASHILLEHETDQKVVVLSNDQCATPILPISQNDFVRSFNNAMVSEAMRTLVNANEVPTNQDLIDTASIPSVAKITVPLQQSPEGKETPKQIYESSSPNKINLRHTKRNSADKLRKNIVANDILPKYTKSIPWKRKKTSVDAPNKKQCVENDELSSTFKSGADLLISNHEAGKNHEEQNAEERPKHNVNVVKNKSVTQSSLIHKSEHLSLKDLIESHGTTTNRYSTSYTDTMMIKQPEVKSDTSKCMSKTAQAIPTIQHTNSNLLPPELAHNRHESCPPSIKSNAPFNKSEPFQQNTKEQNVDMIENKSVSSCQSHEDLVDSHRTTSNRYSSNYIDPMLIKEPEVQSSDMSKCMSDNTVPKDTDVQTKLSTQDIFEPCNSENNPFKIHTKSPKSNIQSDKSEPFQISKHTINYILNKEHSVCRQSKNVGIEEMLSPNEGERVTREQDRRKHTKEFDHPKQPHSNVDVDVEFDKLHLQGNKNKLISFVVTEDNKLKAIGPGQNEHDEQKPCKNEDVSGNEELLKIGANKVISPKISESERCNNNQIGRMTCNTEETIEKGSSASSHTEYFNDYGYTSHNVNKSTSFGVTEDNDLKEKNPEQKPCQNKDTTENEKLHNQGSVNKVISPKISESERCNNIQIGRMTCNTEETIEKGSSASSHTEYFNGYGYTSHNVNKSTSFGLTEDNDLKEKNPEQKPCQNKDTIENEKLHNQGVNKVISPSVKQDQISKTERGNAPNRHSARISCNTRGIIEKGKHSSSSSHPEYSSGCGYTSHNPIHQRGKDGSVNNYKGRDSHQSDYRDRGGNNHYIRGRDGWHSDHIKRGEGYYAGSSTSRDRHHSEHSRERKQSYEPHSYSPPEQRSLRSSRSSNVLPSYYKTSTQQSNTTDESYQRNGPFTKRNTHITKAKKDELLKREKTKPRDNLHKSPSEPSKQTSVDYSWWEKVAQKVPEAFYPSENQQVFSKETSNLLGPQSNK